MSSEPDTPTSRTGWFFVSQVFVLFFFVLVSFFFFNSSIDSWTENGS